jgi:two-component system OmpR family sensor kinase/two-component system sensor histidine kinase BaeS
MAGFLALFWLLSLAGCFLLSYLAGTGLGYIPLPQGAEALGRAASLVVLAIGLVGIWVAVRGLRRMAAPVEGLIGAAGKVEAGDYSARVPEGGAGQLRGLVRAFNSMSARLESETAQRRKFLADVAHELKTPLTVIRGTLEGIADGVYPAEARQLTALLDEVNRLAQRVEDLQVLSLAESGALKLNREPTSLPELLVDVAGALEPQAKASGVQVAVETEPGLPPVEIDPARMRAVLTNLVTNSLRYTPPGGSIRLTAEVDPRRGVARLLVRDTGRGIPQDLLPHVFERFAKSPDSSGSGLGLAIARDLVRAHGGDIGVESRVGEGTSFWMEIPL